MSGFLYQVWTVGGLMAESQVLGRADDSTSLGALVRLTRNGVVENERFNQDLALSPIARDCEQGIVEVALRQAQDRDARPSVVNALFSALKQPLGEPSMSAVCRTINALALAGYLGRDFIAPLERSY